MNNIEYKYTLKMKTPQNSYFEEFEKLCKKNVSLTMYLFF